jgi:hypothetical protein
MSDFPQDPVGGLVEPEGVNAGSAEQMRRAEPPPPDATIGDPDHDDPRAVPRLRDTGAWEVVDVDDVLGAPEPQPESGQDAGSRS